MFLNGIDFPNQIIDAIKEDRLVVFAGAGASVDKPTSLPNFEKLAKEIAEGTGHTLEKGDSCEVFLGTLKFNGIDVNGQAAEILGQSCLEPNILHKAIVDLFVSPERLKIVTTNYDQMFERVAEQYNIPIRVFDAPALPLGSDVNGIVHLHGNINNPKYMVVTDEDFGKAYLTDGYASKFLVKLFESYTVLFVGYSYNDTILRYLTRAMSRGESGDRFIMTDDTKSNWNALGISPITFPKRSYKVMREGLIKVGIRTKKGLVEWNNQFSDIAEHPPKDLTIDTEIDYCLESIERTRVLANCVRGKEWLELLDRKGVFDCCFSIDSELTTTDKIWAQWLCENFIGKDDESFIGIVAKHGSGITKSFAKIISLSCDCSQTRLCNEYFAEYVSLIYKYLHDPWSIMRLIENAHSRKLTKTCIKLFRKLLDFELRLEKKFWSSDNSFEYKHHFTGEYYHLNTVWSWIRDMDSEEYASDIFLLVNRTIAQLHDCYEEIGQANDGSEPWCMIMAPIEERETDYHDNPLSIINQMFMDSCYGLQELDPEFLRGGINNCLKSGSRLLQKMALRILRDLSVFTTSEKLKLILDNSVLHAFGLKEQVFLLVKSIFSHLSATEQDQLIDEILTYDNNQQKRHSDYYIYNWCIWLQRIDSQNVRINKIINDILEENDFQPREHPERDIDSSTEVWTGEQSPIHDEVLLKMDCKDAIDYLVKFKEEHFNGPTRWEVLGAFSRCIKTDNIWAGQMLNEMIAYPVEDKDIWNRWFQGIVEAEVSLEFAMELVTIIADHIEMIPYEKGAADFLWHILQRDDIKESFLQYEDALHRFSELIWEHRDRNKCELQRLIDATLNTTQGLVILSWIYMVSFYDKAIIPNSYKSHFEEMLSLKSWEREVAICILVGHFNFFCFRDKSWSVSVLEPFLTGKNKQVFQCAWEGIVFYSGRINKDTADIVSPIFYSALKHITWLEGEVLRRFIDLYLTLLIYVIEKPTLKFIPEFYKASTSKEIKQFIELIKHRLRGMGTDVKIKWWDAWLAKFIENRKKNKPIALEEDENCALLELLPELEEVFDSAVDIFIKGKTPKFADGMIWYSLREKEIGKKFPHSMARLMIKLFSSEIELNFGKDDIIQIVDDMEELSEKEMQQLQEVLLKQNISCKTI